MYGTIVPVLVYEDPAGYRRPSDSSGLFFNRKGIASPPAPNLLMMQYKLPPAVFREDPFIGVIPILDLYQGNTSVTGAANYWLFPPRLRAHEIFETEDQNPHRTDQQVWFQIQRIYSAQIVGYTFPVLDLNDEPWLEPWHKPADPQTALFPFRRPSSVPVVGQQFNFYFNQPKPQYVDAEQDTFLRRPAVDMLQIYSRQQVVIPPPPPPPGYIPIPSFLGLHWNEASLLIFELGFEQNQPPIMVPLITPYFRGEVVAQNPSAGTFVPPGCDVVLTVTREFLLGSTFDLTV